MESDSSISREMVESILGAITAGKGDIWSVLRFFKNYTETCPYFCYQIKYNNEGQPEAILWATLEICRDLIKYSDAVYLDMHKTAMNNIGWYYFAPCVMDSENKVRVATECLRCSESNKMYPWVLQQLEKVEPVYTLKSTRFIFADRLITEELLTMLDITETCILGADQFHLFSHVIPIFFRPTI